MKTHAAARFEPVVCPACRAGMVHRTVVLHAGVDTLVTCGDAWEALTSWLRESFGGARMGKPVVERQQVVREIREQLEAG